MGAARGRSQLLWNTVALPLYILPLRIFNQRKLPASCLKWVTSSKQGESFQSMRPLHWSIFDIGPVTAYKVVVVGC